MDGRPLLTVEGLSAGYGRIEILHGIDLELHATRSMCLIGPNGAGKSTVLNAVFGFADIYGGRIRFEADDLTRAPPHARVRDGGIAYVLQDSSVFPDLSVEDNLRLGAYRASRAEARQGVERIFERHPLLAERAREPARVLSGGERRILEIARALMLRPRLLLLDEPTLGLEPRHIESVFGMLHELKARDQLAILIVEQNIEKGLELADVACVLAAGKVVMSGNARDLARDPAVGRLFVGSLHE